MSRPSTVFLLNPRSAGGATARRVPELEAAAARHLPDFEIWRTEAPGHATELAARAVAAGAGLVVAVGGDGTANEVVNGLFDGDRPRSPSTAFAVLPAGTGGDLVKTLRVPRDVGAAIAAIAAAPSRPIDVLSLRFGGQHRLSVNVTGFGMNGDVAARANRSSKRLGGTATFAIVTIQSALTYRPSPVRMTWTTVSGEQGGWEGRLASAFVANGAYCGGGMWVGRGGAIDDGGVDLRVLPELPVPRMLIGIPHLFRGTLDRVPEIVCARVRRFTAQPIDAAQVLLDIDGEQPGVLPVEGVVLEKSLMVRAFF